MLIVQKYGGATVATPEKIKNVAQRIAELHRQNHQVVVVVSAMGSTTNELIRLAKEISHKPQRREMDMLLTTGERVSMALLSMALIDIGVPAVSFTGSQAGIFTDDSHENAQIIDVKAFRVTEALKAGKVVVLAGFQGVSPQTKEITTLGRGGSDTTAVAMAAYLNADRCEILKDVPSIFTADPRTVNDAKPIEKITYDELVDMTYAGAKVLHFRSAELARLKKVPLYIGPAISEGNKNFGTWISEEGKSSMSQTQYEKNQILGVNSHKEVLKISMNTANLQTAFSNFENFLKKNEIPYPQILQIEHIENACAFYLAGPDEVISAIQTHQKNSESYCTVTMTVRGVSSEELLQKISGTISSYEKIWFQPQSITILAKKNLREELIQKLHSLID